MKRLLGLAALALVPLAAQPSAATFTAASTGAPSNFAAAADFNTVAVALDDPGTPRRGTVALHATASSDRGIAAVAFQAAPAGGSTWTTLCNDTTAPYDCDWATTGADDGLRDVRAVATDAAGHERGAAHAARRIDNTAPSLALAHPGGTAVKGMVPVTVTATDAGAGIPAGGVVVEVRAAGAPTWTELCRSGGTATCNWSTAALANGDYELRASAADALGNAAAAVVLAGRRVDNSAPTSTVQTAPPANARGTVSMTIAAADSGGSGIEKVVFEARPKNTADWYPVCTVTSAPYTCSADSASYGAPDGEYELRGVTHDHAGNQTPSAVVAFRLDNTVPSASLAPPTLAGTVTLSASASDAGSGLASVRIEAAPNNGNYATVCATASCSWAVPAADGLWDLRVVAVDHAGNQRTLDVADRPGGTQPAAAAAGLADGGVAGTLDAGDVLALAFSEPMRPQSLLASWNGTGTQAVKARLTDGTPDTLTVRTDNDAAVVPLAQGVAFGADVVPAGGATFDATLQAAGAAGYTVTLGARTAGAVTPAVAAGTLTWTPASGALDAVGLPALATPLTGTAAP